MPSILSLGGWLRKMRFSPTGPLSTLWFQCFVLLIRNNLPGVGFGLMKRDGMPMSRGGGLFLDEDRREGDGGCLNSGIATIHAIF